MQTEFPYLYGYLLIGILLAPMMTWTFFLKRSRVYLIAQVVAVVALIVGTLSPFKHAVIIWPLFCSLGAALFLKQEYLSIMSPASIAKSLPFAFSLVSATWLTFGLYDWGLLGYDKKFSFYAALHGMYLGWLLIGCFAFLSQTNKSTTLIYTLSSFLCLMAFLLIAFGINGIPYAKPAGVMILAVVVPLCIRLHIACLSRDQKFSRLLAGISLLGLICSMTLAIVHEFWRGPFPYLLDTSYMVSIHGLINAIVVIPCFFFSIFYAYGSDIEF